MIRDGVRRLFTHSFRRRDWRREVEDEIRLHLELRAEALAQQGLAPESATAEAIRRFGPFNESRAQLMNAARHREQRMQRLEFWSTARQDLAFGLRTLGRNKMWTAVAVSTLGLGIGATAAVFSATSSLLLHPLPYPHSDRVVLVQQQPSRSNATGISVSISPNRRLIKAWLAASHSFDDMEPYQERDAQLKTNGDPAPFRVAEILPSFFRFADVRPLIGRFFSAAEVADHAPVVLLSEDAWRTRFGGDPAVLGKAITIDDTLYTIIGVAPRALVVPSGNARRDAAWLPLDLNNPNPSADVVARLKPGVSDAAAARELDAIQTRANASANGPGVSFETVIMAPSSLVGFRQSLIILTWAVALVLLVACTNVAHLLLARTSSRGRELAIRAAIGAGAARLFRQLLTESAVLAVAGGGLGLLLAWVGIRTMVVFRPSALPALAAVHLDGTTLAITASVAVLSALVFGVLGAFQAGRRTHESLKAGSLSTSHSRAQDRVRSLLVISEMAMSAMLLVGASLLVRSVIELQHANIGFNPASLYAIDSKVHEPRQTSANTAALAQARRELSAQIAGRLEHTPHVVGITLAAVRPGMRSFQVGALEMEGGPVPDAKTMAFIDNNEVQPNFFHVMGIQLVSGGTFTDTSDASNQVIVNQGFARKQWGNESAIGKRLRLDFQGQRGDWWTIVGVAADVATGGATQESSAPMLYFPERYENSMPFALVRTDGTSDAMTQVRSVMRSIDPARLRPQAIGIEDLLRTNSAEPRFVTALLIAFTALATLLAAVGLYGVMAYGVAQRTREIGIRIALGAPAAWIGRSVVLRGAMLGAIGAAIGLTVAAFGGKLLQHQLFGVSAHDPVAFATGFGLMVVIAVAACLAPTRRAVRVDPLTAIRTE